ncbi:DUF924 family protein [Arenicella sp. 4NH20-0111]|uniref:DUF924 family protein n=1 Tax=Arenicella sp. 4NH20-0111 TaxID=3127648 RepID=UPI00310739D3
MPSRVLTFWFEEIEPTYWWKKDENFDQLIVDRFGGLLKQASRCELNAWRATPKGRLAEIIVLDQFSRNVYRGTASAFSNDPLALALAQEAIINQANKHLTPIENSFLYMPFMHSESLKIHQIAIDLFKGNGIESSYEFELKHKDIIERFGRYPHRNAVLGRQSTQEEVMFLKSPGSSF